ncbi:MAG: purine-nucleoside phosphorylase [Bacteroidia bacterium]|nr:purine-nucleoside phosphorylase [Bacteroidia bacterium]
MRETADFLRSKISADPEVGIILGSGLGGLVKEISIEIAIPYEEIPNFPVSTVEGHSGKLIFGRLGGKFIMAMQGRFHFYEGYTMQQCTFPVRVMKFLGVKNLLVSNASGGVNLNFRVGDLMILTDHINLFPTNPLMGPNIAELGPRFPDMSEAYSKVLVAKAESIAERNGIKVQKGVYAGLSGPCFETPAEYKYVRSIGADAVGMSTVPEVIVARHGGTPVFAISIITDMGVGAEAGDVSHEDVIQVANSAEPKMTLIMKELITEL